MNKTGIKRVSGADVVNYLDFGRRQAPLLMAAATDGGSGAAFHDNDLGSSRQEVECLCKIVSPSDMFRLALIGQEDIDVLQDFEQILGPLIFRIIVGVE